MISHHHPKNSVFVVIWFSFLLCITLPSEGNRNQLVLNILAPGSSVMSLVPSVDGVIFSVSATGNYISSTGTGSSFIMHFRWCSMGFRYISGALCKGVLPLSDSEV